MAKGPEALASGEFTERIRRRGAGVKPKVSCPVSRETQQRVLDQFRWAVGQGLLRVDTQHVTPERHHFTVPRGKRPETAQALLADFQRIGRIAHAQIDLLPLDRLTPPGDPATEESATDLICIATGSQLARRISRKTRHSQQNGRTRQSPLQQGPTSGTP